MKDATWEGGGGREWAKMGFCIQVSSENNLYVGHLIKANLTPLFLLKGAVSRGD